jgi:hypothetical protein
MKERYRTLLGHFRHEIGHYFWDRLVRDREPLEACRELFGDERVDYALALKNHYAQAPEPDYAERFISQYAASHPWEDFAETFAHYLHMIDTLETAAQFGFSAAPAERSDDFAALMASWYPLSVALNSLNRSMGMPDPYPFVLSEPIERKLAFVHRLISDARSLASSYVSRLRRERASRRSGRCRTQAPPARSDAHGIKYVTLIWAGAPAGESSST